MVTPILAPLLDLYGVLAIMPPLSEKSLSDIATTFTEGTAWINKIHFEETGEMPLLEFPEVNLTEVPTSHSPMSARKASDQRLGRNLNRSWNHLFLTMDRENNEIPPRRSRSLGMTSTSRSSMRTLSLKLSGTDYPEFDEDMESRIVSQAGDIGDRALHSKRRSDSGSLSLTLDAYMQNEVLVPIPEFPATLNIVSPGTQIPSEIVCPLSQIRPRRSRSLGMTGTSGSSMRTLSLRLLGTNHAEFDEDMESRIVSEAGDIGDRALHSRRRSDSGSPCLSLETYMQNEVLVPIPEFPATSNTVFPGTQIPSEIMSPLSTDAILESEEENGKGGKLWEQWQPVVEHVSCLIFLSVFGILGVLTRYVLQKLFGPGRLGVTSSTSILYLDLPSNMVGSFLMGWFGVVFKGDISRRSDQLAIGLTTGYLGSLTTFSGWNQAMLNMSAKGHWVFTALGFLLSLLLCAHSIIVGVHTAKGFRLLLRRLDNNGIRCCRSEWKIGNYKCHLIFVLALTVSLVLLLTLSGILEKKEFKSSNSEAKLWLGCLVAPPGVWIRWWLSRLNGQGLGHWGRWKWIPFGTLIANVSAACIMAALATVMREVNTKTCGTVVGGIQLGFLGCLSTVSTFIAEYNAMSQSSRTWRAYAYATITIIISFGMGTLIYSVPVWTKRQG
ncbi:hypothetical protein Nepgr_002112 [Nepenthes gracilis]|uniref:Uncharacterized protein n=1 Tax=Nepenthes gracilis TaxID=150966 RepID=A0AAD3RY34_NEPGR|nr:hypothetical protein Nepgr_002112 [Nepenthes gracilis]